MNKIIVILFLFCTNILFGQEVIKNLQWLNNDTEIKELTTGNGLTLSADSENIKNGEQVIIKIWAKGEKYDSLVGEYISRVNDNKIMFHWTLVFEKNKLQNYLDEIAENSFAIPRYYFQIQYNQIKSEDSKILEVMAWIRRTLVDVDGEIKRPMANTGYILIGRDGTVIRGFADSEGHVREDNIKIITDFRIVITDEINSEIIPPYHDPEKPVYYTIKENDNLWKIASYDFIYGDPYSWKLLYESNRNNFIDNDNPDLIETGQTLFIPALSGEFRNGTRE